jgi:hypothetical protein
VMKTELIFFVCACVHVCVLRERERGGARERVTWHFSKGTQKALIEVTYTKVGTEVMPPVFLSETVIAVIMNLICMMDAFFFLQS